MRRRAVLLATAAAAAVAAAVVLWPSPSRTLTLSLDGARGLVRGAEVRIGGLPVGKVDRIWIAGDGYPRARLAVDTDADLRSGTRAALRLASLSGERNRYVALDPGDGPALPDGARLPRHRTRVPVEIDDVLQTFDAGTRADARATLRGLRASARGRGPDLRATLREAPRALGVGADALRDVRADGAALRALVTDGRRISGALASRRDTVGAATDRLAGLLRTTAGRQRELDATIAGLPTALASASGALDEARTTIAPLRTTLRAARPGLARLPGTARAAADTLDAARPVLAGLSAAAADAPAQLGRVTPLLRDAAPVARRATPVLRRVGPMGDQARVRLPDFFSFFANWADFTAGYDANGHAARVGIVLPPGGTNAGRADAQERGQLDTPYLRVPGALEDEPWRDFEDSFVAGD